jgi:hypothetical protein
MSQKRLDYVRIRGVKSKEYKFKRYAKTMTEKKDVNLMDKLLRSNIIIIVLLLLLSNSNIICNDIIISNDNRSNSNNY